MALVGGEIGEDISFRIMLLAGKCDFGGEKTGLLEVSPSPALSIPLALSSSTY